MPWLRDEQRDLAGVADGLSAAALALSQPQPRPSTRGAFIGQAADMDDAVDLAGVLSTFEETWSPRTVASLNDYDVRVVKTKGEFTRHSHPDTDEFFLVLRGTLTIRMDAGDVERGPGQVFVVPRGVFHQPVSADGAEVVLIEPGATVNTGDTPSELTAERRVV